MAPASLRPALQVELDALWPAVRAAHLFPDKRSFRKHYEEAPWRVRMSSAGAAAVVERWRADLDILAIRGLWCMEQAIPQMLSELGALAEAQGFARLLSPLTPVDSRRMYERAGMEVVQRLVSFRLDRTAAAAIDAPAPNGVRLRRATPADPAILDALDRASFDDFWAYGPERIARYIAEERVVVAESEGRAIGYTLCTVERSSGTLGRLAVSPESRRSGVGAFLVRDAVTAMLGSGASAITLCTQQENDAARSLYRAMGFREIPGGLVMLMSDTATEGGR